MAEARFDVDTLLARIGQLEAEGAHRFDPARFCFLQRQGQRLRQMRVCGPRSLQRLADALSDYQQSLDRSRDLARQAIGEAPEQMLQELFEAQDFRTLLRRVRRATTVTQLQQLQAHYSKPATPDAAPRDPLQQQLHAQESALLATDKADAAPPQAPRLLQALNRIRASSREQQRRQRIDNALNQVPSDAGPLNSHRLVSQALRTLQALSPAYLEHFANHVDALMALEKLARKRPA